jgi:putative ubiquitin-RnfH superfamily antitoxin RatB of RatAB toxin-antitoxin module
MNQKMTDITVEIVFALPDKQSLKTHLVAAGTTVAEVILGAGLDAEFPDFDFRAGPVGIWGREVERNHVLRDGDRVEIYRKLELEPREARRRLALSGRTMRSDNSGEPD